MRHRNLDGVWVGLDVCRLGGNAAEVDRARERETDGRKRQGQKARR